MATLTGVERSFITLTASPSSRMPEAMGTVICAGFGSASLDPLAVGMVLDATGGGNTGALWGAPFLTMAAGVALGPLFLRRARHTQDRPGIP